MTNCCPEPRRGDARATVIARLIANTRTRNRPDNLIDIARDIRWLEGDLGSLQKVSRTIGISTDMLRRFLSVETLCPELQKLVEQRRIDTINTLYYIRNLDAAAQMRIAEEVLADRLSTEDVRVLAPLHSALPEMPIDRLVSRVQESRDVKIYVAYFRVPLRVRDVEGVRSRFEEIVGQNEVLSLTVEDQVGKLELTRSGSSRLREAARARKLSLRRLVESVVLSSADAGDALP